MSQKICDFQQFSKSINPVSQNRQIPNNIICVSIFIKQYDQQFISKYQDNCLNLFLNYKKFLPNFQLIVFTDNTIYKSQIILDTINKSDLNIVLYNCQQLIDQNTNEHKGLIGTVMRYYPLFSKEYSKAKFIIITDIDLKNYDLQNFSYCINYMKANPRIQFFFKTPGIHFKNEWAHPLYPQIVSMTIISKIQFPSSIFDDFLNKITSNKKSKLSGVTKINHSRILNLSYGIDEFFLNFYLMPWIIHKHIVYGTTTIWDYKLILHTFTLNPNDPYLDEKIIRLQNLRKKDQSYLNSLLDHLNIFPDQNLFNRCSHINLHQSLSPSSIDAINLFIFTLSQDPHQRFFSPWQMQFIFYNIHQKTGTRAGPSIIFLTLKQLSIIHERRLYHIKSLSKLFLQQYSFLPS